MSVLVVACRRVLERAADLGYQGRPCLEVDAERAVDSSAPVLNISGERIYKLDNGFRIRLRRVGRTPGGRMKYAAVSFFDVSKPMEEPVWRHGSIR